MWSRVALGVLCLPALIACSHDPAKAFRRSAADLGLQKDVATGSDFRHTLFLNAAAVGRACRLHVYLDGDGTPWVATGIPASDPTARDPLVLRLMSLDSSPALYLGRPCYAGQADAPPCEPLHWTHQRYSERVVDSMVSVLKVLIESKGTEEIQLIGYSGGGALAMLIAERIPEAHAVVTLAGNLDPDGWARLHGYTPLSGSLNPTLRAPLPPSVQQLHFIGEEDEIVTPELVLDASARQPEARAVVLEGVDHACCWESLWPTLLNGLVDGHPDERCGTGDQ